MMGTSTPSPTNAAGPGLESGDRFELPGFDPAGRLALPRVLGPDGFAIDRLDDPAGRPLEVSFDPASRALVVPGLAGWSPTRAWRCGWSTGSRAASGWSSSRRPRRPRTARSSPSRACASPSTRRIGRCSGAAGPPAGLKEFDLALHAAQLATHAGFDRLIALPMVRDIELLEHQIRTAKTVLRRFRGRALLCDEVGLGKTIEAGLVLSELKVRGLIRSVLILVPPSLIEQWQGEMRRKFSLELIGHDDPAFRERGQRGLGRVRSDHRVDPHAKREPHRAAILARSGTW
jgi:hypothetical protein